MLNAELVAQKFNFTDKKKRKNSLFTGFYNNIQRPIKREIKRKRQREVKGELKESRGGRERAQKTRGHEKQSSGGQITKHGTV